MISMTSSSRSFAALARYLEGRRSGEEVDRVDWRAARNLPTDDPELAARIMRATAAQNPRVEKPVYHLSLSFDPADRVDRVAMERVADRVIEALGLREHQVLLVAHRDRDHPHLHLLINRVHPETGVAWDRWQDRKVIQQVLREEERALGLRAVESSPATRAPGASAERHAPEREAEAPPRDHARREAMEPPVGLVPPARPVQSRIEQLAADLRALERVEHLTGEHETVRSESAVARARLAELDNAVKRATLAEQMFREALAPVYREPEAARRAFSALAAERGPDHAAQAMRDTPERFGDLAIVDRRRALGLLHAEDDGPARQSARVAARLGASALAAERTAWATASDVQTRRLEDAFATALRGLYERPGEARAEFDRLVRHDGVEHAAAVLRDRSARLGALRPDSDASPAGAAARAAEAATLGLEATRARATARSDDIHAWQGIGAAERAGAEMTAARREVARTSEAEHVVRRALATSPSAEDLRARIGRAAERLLPHEVRRLKTLVSAPQLAAVMQLRAVVRDAVLGRDDERG